MRVLNLTCQTETMCCKPEECFVKLKYVSCFALCEAKAPVLWQSGAF